MTDALAISDDVEVLFAGLAHRPRRITADSRDVHPGDAFAALPGTRTDGRAYIAEAISRGSDLVLWDAAGFSWDPSWRVPNRPVGELRHRLGAIADAIYDHPSRAMWVVGVTGTNGKTTCAQWTAQCLDHGGRRCAIIGTLGNGFAGTLRPTLNTTPDAAAMHEMLAQFRGEGAKAATMEVSSHGLDQGRVNAIAFDVALFTNLTRDHLDYHQTMAAYGTAKARLFAWPGLAASVINADDAFGASLIDAARGRGGRVLSYGIAQGEIRATTIATTAGGLALSVETPAGRGEIEAPVVGEFNALNLLAVLGVLLASDVALDAALAALARVVPPAGRMQRLGGDALPLVVVDYAHTPDALAKVLGALRPAVAPSRELICLFGCGGDRDKGKRPQMGEVAGREADRVIVTSDNPRSEDPALIADAVVTGIRGTANRRWSIELDRAKPIAGAIASAGQGDVVLLAGKGHEDYQELNGARLPFSDVRAATAALAAWGGR